MQPYPILYFYLLFVSLVKFRFFVSYTATKYIQYANPTFNTYLSHFANSIYVSTLIQPLHGVKLFSFIYTDCYLLQSILIIYIGFYWLYI